MFRLMDVLWREYAACREFPLPLYRDWWFPEKANFMSEEAREVCRNCQVLSQCHAWIMKLESSMGCYTRSINGNVAAMTYKERYDLQKTRENRGG